MTNSPATEPNDDLPVITLPQEAPTGVRSFRTIAETLAGLPPITGGCDCDRCRPAHVRPAPAPIP